MKFCAYAAALAALPLALAAALAYAVIIALGAMLLRDDSL